MKFFGRKISKAAIAVIFLPFLAGCATPHIIAPTSEELSAAGKFKKTVAVVGISDEGSQIENIAVITTSKVEGALMSQFNVVDRRRITEIMSERALKAQANGQDLKEIGTLLGADYIVTGTVNSSLTGPEVNNYQNDYKDSFYGSIWEETTAGSDLSLQFLNVDTGMLDYASDIKGIAVKRGPETTYSDRKAFDQALREKQITTAVQKIAGNFMHMTGWDSALIAESLDIAAGNYRNEFRKRFAQEGEIMEKISYNEVMINLGSAYGIVPGDSLAVFDCGPAVKDPKTGITTVPKNKQYTLKVTKVTSGLSCIAKGSEKLIASLRVGDKVYTK